MPVLADDDVVMHGNTKRTGGFHDCLRHVDVCPRRGGIAGRVVVDLRWSTMKHSIMRNTHIKL